VNNQIVQNECEEKIQLIQRGKFQGISGSDFAFSGIPTKQSYQVAFQGGIRRKDLGIAI